MEDDKDKSMSSRDRKMAGRFEGFGFTKEKDDEEKKRKKSVKIPRRGIFFDSEKSLDADGKSDKQEKAGIFGSFIRGKEIDVQSVKPEKDTVVEGAEVYHSIIDNRLKDVEEEISTLNNDSELAPVVADKDFLVNVGDRIDEGLFPGKAVEDALEDIYAPPEADADDSDLNNPDNYSAYNQESGDPLMMRASKTENTMQNTPNVHVGKGEKIAMNELYYREKDSGDVILGGALGYLIGKRRGKLEARADQAQHIAEKEKEIKEFKSKLEETEKTVRKEIYKQEKELMPSKQPETPDTVGGAEEIISKLNIDSTTEEKNIIEQQEERFENNLSEYNKVSKTEKTPENVGVPDKKKDSLTELFEKSEKIRSLTIPELLEIAERVSFEKTNLKELYEHNRIDAVNLRRVLIEFMNGGTLYEKLLRNSLQAVEMQRELRGEIKHDDAGVYSLDPNNNNTDRNLAVSDSEKNARGIQKTENYENSKRTKQDKIYERSEKYNPVNQEVIVVLGVMVGVAIVLLALLFG